jgi:hypothetical protein
MNMASRRGGSRARHHGRKVERYYRGQDGKIYAQANNRDRRFGLQFASVPELRKAISPEFRLKEVPSESVPEVFYVDELRGVRYGGKEYLRGIGGYPLVYNPAKRDYDGIANNKIPKPARDLLWR